MKKGEIMTPKQFASVILLLTMISGLAEASPIVIVPDSVRQQYQFEKATTPEQAAREFLQTNAPDLGVQPDLSDLETDSVTDTPAGFVVRFRQMAHEIEIDRADLVVTLAHDLSPLSYVNDTHRLSGLRLESSPQFAMEEAEAREIAYEKLKLTASPTREEITRKLIMKGRKLRPVFQVQLSAPVDRRYAWELLIDANSGEVYRSKDLILNHKDRAAVRVNVFDPNPTIKSGFAVDGTPGYTDNNNANSDFFTKIMTEVTLDNLTQRQDGKYIIAGPNMVMVDSESPKNPDCSFSGESYKLARNQPCFDAFNIYYHIDKQMKYLNGQLGFNLKPMKYAGGVKVDPYGLNGQDNSHYSPFSDELAFGEGGVNDGQDHDVVIHELGHALHSWITKGKLSQVEGLSEGSGDYWAASYSRQFMKPGHVAYFWTFSYDGHNKYWPGRSVNVAAKYPSGAQGSIHSAGQLWATVCMEIHAAIGKEKADKLFWTALASLNSSSSQLDAAKSYVVATKRLYPGDLETVVQKFVARGYTVR